MNVTLTDGNQWYAGSVSGDITQETADAWAANVSANLGITLHTVFFEDGNDPRTGDLLTDPAPVVTTNTGARMTPVAPLTGDEITALRKLIGE